MKKGLLFLSLLIILIFLAAGFVSAAENSMELNGISFNIPSGYVEDDNVQTIDEIKNYGNITIVETHKSYFDRDGKYLGITVADYGENTTLDSINIGGEQKTIGSVTGYYSYDDLNFFKYFKDGKVITISYEDESIVNDLIN